MPRSLRLRSLSRSERRVLNWKLKDLSLAVRVHQRYRVVDEVAKDGASQRSLSGRVCGKLQALSAPLIDGGKNITPEERLIADDRDDTIDRQ